MNKTVNINLASIFFHIDEDAYLKLQHYLEAIKRSFTDSQGRDEIIADIEARIAELFSEKMKNEKQVISIAEVEEVITVMGQPEDYHLDEEIFKDEATASHQNTTKTKQLFRDTSNSYAGGVISGLSHYLGINPIWIRLSWVLLTIFSSGAFILIYIAFWIFAPEAKTTADYLAMKGEAININTIEKKITEGVNNVTNKVKSSSTSFSEALISFLSISLKIFIKVIGTILILMSGLMLIGLFISLFTFGIFDFTETSFTEYIDVVAHPSVPFWLISILLFFAASIPVFFLFILGLKIIINDLKSIGKPAKLTLLAAWILTIISLSIIGILQITQKAYDAVVIENTRDLNIGYKDTMYIKMVGNDRYLNNLDHRKKFKIKRDENDDKIIVIQGIKIFIKENKEDSIPKIIIKKTAEGNSYDNAKERANALQYSYKTVGNSLLLNGYAITDYKYKYNNQKIKIILSIPSGMTILADKNTTGYNNSWKHNEYLTLNGKEEEHLRLTNGVFICENCPKDKWEYKKSDEGDNIKININSDNDDAHLKIDKNGLRIKNQEIDIKIDEHGIKIKTDS